MNLMITEDVYQCDDGHGNGCGRMFDASIVPRNHGLCRECAADLSDDRGC